MNFGRNLQQAYRHLAGRAKFAPTIWSTCFRWRRELWNSPWR